MRVRKLWLQQFKNLQNFEIEFSSGRPISVVVGRNGSGKSNLLEALSLIFRDLDLGEVSEFTYSIIYDIRGEEIRVESDPRRQVPRRVFVDGKRASLKHLDGSKDGVRRLPDFVFGYYSGPTNRLERHFLRHQAAYHRSLREAESLPLRRLFYAQPSHSQFVLLAFFLADATEITKAFLSDYLRIEGFDSALFVLQEPNWKATGGDERFWNARGAVASLLAEISRLSLATMRLRVAGNSTELSRRRTSEQLFLYLSDLQSLSSLASRYDDSPQKLFSAFESILAADLLHDLRVKVRARGSDGTLTFRELSEGEQQLLMVLGLLRFTQEEESLFLLDEPDTHLNPAWSVRYSEMLLTHSGDRIESGQILMASHDPLVVASMTADQVRLLQRDDDTGEVVAAVPQADPKGMGVSALLTSDVYGLPSELDPETFRKLQRRRWLATATELSVAERDELRELTDYLENLDFNFAVRDPLFTRFERAMREVGANALSPVTQAEAHAVDRDVVRLVRELIEKSTESD